MKRTPKLYMMVTKDEYELPLAVADNIPQLARMVGVNERAIRVNIYNGSKIYKVVELDDVDFS